jgi:hypothetical protein
LAGRVLLYIINVISPKAISPINISFLASLKAIGKSILPEKLSLTLSKGP